MQRRQFLAATGLTLLGGTTGCVGQLSSPLAPTSDEPIAVDETWNQPGGGPGHAYAASGSGPGAAIESRWRFSDGDSHLEPMAIADDTVFVASGSTVVALDASRGTERWRAAVDSNDDLLAVGPDHLFLSDGWIEREPETASVTPYPESSPHQDRFVLLEDLFVYLTDDAVVAGRPGADEARWRRPLDRPHSLCGVADQMVVVATETGLAGLSLSDGSQQWLREDLWSEVSFVDVAGADERVYATTWTRDATVFALDAASGETAWTYEPPTQVWLTADSDHVVLGGLPDVEPMNRVDVLDAAGDRQWVVPTDSNDTTVHVPVLADGVVYAAHVADCFAYDLASGEELWSLSPDGLLPSDLYPLGQPLVAGDGLFLEQDGAVYGFGPA
ncbi:PQQ-binding-like beta-propeller repeat protein [Halomicrobium sp. HM KBTZ05]|uniref:outer membrane protein assembly factor BamB family protein n=1 Tax=Halomicrobium sp. HM KBTZ05 TaxID=3242663 RepID=UPI0035591BA0